MRPLLLLLLLLAAPARAVPWKDSLDEALAESRATGKPVLMEFKAPWCYSCYYMEKRVLSQEPFARLSGRLILLGVDVDREEGRALKEKYRVTFLPTVVVLGAAGEAGRIVGEQTERDFLEQLQALLAAAPGGAEERAVASLRARLAEGDLDRAQKDLAGLSRETREALSPRKDWRILSARLSLKRAVRAKDPAGLEGFKELLDLDDSCELAYDAGLAGELLPRLAAPERKAILERERRSLETLAQKRIFAAGAERCADFRTAVEQLSGVYGALGLKDRSEELLKRAAAFLEAEDARVGEDRNLDDNLRVFLALAGEEAKLRALFEKLVAAYPADHVYAYRFAQYLESRKKPEEALPWIEKADKLAYGANRLAVTRLRAQILAKLGRKDEARALLERDAKAGKKAFPQEAAQLEALLANLGK